MIAPESEALHGISRKAGNADTGILKQGDCKEALTANTWRCARNLVRPLDHPPRQGVIPRV